MAGVIVAGIGPAAHDRADLLLDLGAHHPSTHGSLRLALETDGDVVTAAEPLVGHLHRGVEKLFEARDYRQLTMLANRHDWLSALANEVPVVTAAEQLLGIEVPERAVWLRTLFVELNRVTAHLLFLAAFREPIDPALHAGRESLVGLVEEATGGRMHAMYARIGGVVVDLPAGWVDRLAAALDRLPAIPGPPEHLHHKGFLDPALVDPYGVTGPLARASGATHDLRRDAPSGAYPELDVPLVVQADGDAAARHAQLAAEVEMSKTLVLQCIARLRTLSGPVNVKLPKVVRPPEGAVYVRAENPLGVMGCYLVSRGQKTPWRLHLRTPSFSNVQVLRAALPGTRVDDLATVLASFLFVIGDVDK